MVYPPYLHPPSNRLSFVRVQEFLFGCAARFPNPDPISDQNFIFHTRFQTWSQKSMPDFRPTYMCAPCFKFVLHKQKLFNYYLD